MTQVSRERPALRRRAGSEGFTLVEALVTLVILSAGLVLVLQAFDSGLFAVREARECVRANLLIREKMSELRLAVLECGDFSAVLPRGRFPAPFMDFAWELESEPLERVSAPDAGGNRVEWTLNRVVVSVGRERGGRKYSAAAILRTKRLESAP